jgi:hypothetical protein
VPDGVFQGLSSAQRLAFLALHPRTAASLRCRVGHFVSVFVQLRLGRGCDGCGLSAVLRGMKSKDPGVSEGGSQWLGLEVRLAGGLGVRIHCRMEEASLEANQDGRRVEVPNVQFITASSRGGGTVLSEKFHGCRRSCPTPVRSGASTTTYYCCLLMRRSGVGYEEADAVCMYFFRGP